MKIKDFIAQYEPNEGDVVVYCHSIERGEGLGVVHLDTYDGADERSDSNWVGIVGIRDGKLVILEKQDADKEPRHAGAFEQPQAVNPVPDYRRRDFIERWAPEFTQMFWVDKKCCVSPVSGGVAYALELWQELHKENDDGK